MADCGGVVAPLVFKPAKPKATNATTVRVPESQVGTLYSQSVFIETIP